MSGIDNFINKKGQSEYYITSQPANNVVNSSEKISQTPTSNQSQVAITNSTIRDEFVKEKKNNGLVRKFYNFLKNTTNLGLGSKAVEKEIDKFEKGEISEENIKETIAKYKNSQENSVQTFADTATAATTITGYYLVNNFVKRYQAQNELNAIPQFIKKIKKNTDNIFFKRLLSIDNILKSKRKTTLFMLPILGIIGGITKLAITKAERIGSKEFKVDKKAFTDKKELKAEKKKARKARRKTNFKNFLTGAANGILAPVTALAGGIIGVPAYILTTTGLRYATNNKNKDKSLNDFAQSFKDNAVVNTLTTAAIAVPAFKKAHFSHVLSKNLDKVVDKLKDVKLELPDLPSSKSAYQELEDFMLNSDAIKRILKHNRSYSNMDETINKLTDENIFAVKFLQIKNNGILTYEHNQYQGISNALRENCPPTRTLEEAQEHINKIWGTPEFKVSKLLGVGTIAETYLAKNSSGKEVCIKVLKKGINEEKIARDKDKFIKLIIGNKSLDKLDDNQKYLIKNINDLAEGILKEVDFVNEMNAAKELKKYCKVAEVVVPMEAKPGIYVMEKAPGISIKTLVDYYDCESRIKYFKKLDDADWVKSAINSYEKDLQKIKSRAPEFEDFNLTTSQIKKLLKTYIDLQVEQFAKVDKNGKVIHADIHPGNIFINLEALKSGKGKLLTLIDTGNTIKLTKDQAMASLKIVGYIKNGNTRDLANIVLQDAILPKGHSKEEALKLVEKDLKTCFFDNKTKIETMNLDTFYALSDNILRKYNIIPNNTQLNLNKAKISAKNSFEDLIGSFFEKKYGDKNWDDSSKEEMIAAIMNATKDMAEIEIKLKSANTIQETKNLTQMSPKEAMKFLINKNMLKTNSEEYLTYKMKQDMPGPEIKEEDILKKIDEE